MAEARPVTGLDGVVAAETRLSGVDGEKGELILAGFSVDELAPRATFEEVMYLLWHDSLPTAARLEVFRCELARSRGVPPLALAVLEAAAARRAAPMDALQAAAAVLFVKPGDSQERAAISLVARFPTLVAAYWRIRNGLPVVAPHPDLGHAANYLAMLTGEEPSTARVRALDTYLCTVIDHGLNASTFAARVIIATQSDLLSAVVGALGALKGPLHGGAPGPALDMVFEIGSADAAEPFLRAKLLRGERLMGFGHRIYRVRDPRADVLAAAARILYETDADRELYALALHVEQTALRLLEERKPGRVLQTNVEFYTALLLHGIGLPVDLFTPTFALGRVAGWIAHCFEQQRVGRLIRPQSAYVGERNRTWIPTAER